MFSAFLLFTIATAVISKIDRHKKEIIKRINEFTQNSYTWVTLISLCVNIVTNHNEEKCTQFKPIRD